MTSVDYGRELHAPQNESKTGSLIAAVALIVAVSLAGAFASGPVEVTPDFHGNSGSLALVK